MGFDGHLDQASQPDAKQQEKNAALFRAIKTSKITFLINIIYFIWRAVSIIRYAGHASWGQVAAHVAFLIVEWTFAVTGILNSLLLLGLGKKWTPQEAQRASLEDDVPCIDVFLPCYGEDIDIIRDTVVACINQDYPSEKYRVVLLDDGNSQEAKDLVTEISNENPTARLHYATRGAVIKIHSKAANINFGLDFVRTLKEGPAPYFGVLDIDMIPTVEWLRATIPFVTEDPLVALAGSPQKFYNLPQGFSLASRYHLETDVMQRLFDANGKALCMGSGYLARRSIIEELGGFPAMVKQEDTFIVSIILQSYGYRTRLIEEEHQYGIYATTYTDLSKNMTKWMTGIIHAYSLFWHPIMASKTLGAKIGGVFPILHMTVLRLFMMLSLPTILFLARGEVVPTYSSSNFTTTLFLAAITYSATYSLSWHLSVASGGTVSLDDGQRLWHLPYQLKGLIWLVQHSILGDTKLPRFTTTGADVAATRKSAPSGFLGRLRYTLFMDGAWMHMVFLACLFLSVQRTLSEKTTTSSYKSHHGLVLAASIAYPPFTKILAECFYQSFVPILYCLSPDPNVTPREAYLEIDEKTGVTKPTIAAITPYRPPFWGTLGNTGVMWAFFILAPVFFYMSR